MERVKKITGFLFMVIIFMSHLVTFLHSFEHHDNFNTTSSNELKFEQTADIKEHCCFCDVYLNLNYSQIQPLEYSLIVPVFISNQLLDENKSLISVILYRKKSRAPPSSLA